MNINLLPRKTFVEKRFFVLIVTMLVALLAIAYGFWSMYMNHKSANLELQVEVQAKKLEQARLLNNLGWNEEVQLYEEQIVNIRRYQLLADALLITEVNWAEIFSHIQALLPNPSNLLSIMTEGDTISGIAQFGDITLATRFIEDLQNYKQIKGVYFELAERNDTNDITGITLENDTTVEYEVTFTAFLNVLPF